MLIEALLSYWVKIFGLFFGPIDIPPLPDEVRTIMNEVMVYITAGMELLGNWTHLPYLLTLFGIVVLVDAAILVYNIVMWIIKKIPMAGMQ